MARLTGIPSVDVVAHKDKNLDQECYRGSAPMAHLALISQPDIFDQFNNPEGLQRDLSVSHANGAYDYAAGKSDPAWPRAFPEVVLNVRNKRAVDIEPAQHGSDGNLYRMRFNAEKAKPGDIVVSRVDGNHRLFYARG